MKNTFLFIHVNSRILVPHGRLVRRHSADWSETGVRIAIRRSCPFDENLLAYRNLPDGCGLSFAIHLWRFFGGEVWCILPKWYILYILMHVSQQPLLSRLLPDRSLPGIFSSTSVVSNVQWFGDAGSSNNDAWRRNSSLLSHFLTLFHVDRHRHSLDYSISNCLDHSTTHLQPIILCNPVHAEHWYNVARLTQTVCQDIVMYFVIIRESWPRHPRSHHGPLKDKPPICGCIIGHDHCLQDGFAGSEHQGVCQ